MSNTCSSKKSVRKILYRTSVNTSRHSKIKTCIRKFENFCIDKDISSAKKTFLDMQIEIMKGVNKGIFHKNKASRTISRLYKHLKKI